MKYESGLNGFDSRIGGSAGKNTHGGTTVDRPVGMPTKDKCSHIASDSNQLAEYVQKDGATIWLDESVGEILFKGKQNIWFGDNVTIVGQYCDPNYPGMGTVIKQDYYHRNLFLSAGGVAPKLWGVPLIGPILGDVFLRQNRKIGISDVYFDPRSEDRTNGGELDPEDWYASGLHCYDDSKLFAFGCLFAGWSLAGLEIGSKNVETEAEIHQSTFILNAMETLGYGVELYNGDQWFDLCFFDGNRHAISAFGYPNHTYDVTRSVSGPDDVAGHVLDMHDYVPPNRGGKAVQIRACSNLTDADVNGDPQEFFAQRGVSTDGDRIWDCATVHEKPPREPGKQGDFVRQEDPEQRDEWENFTVEHNHFGSAQHLDFGAPLSESKKDELKQERLERKLAIIGSGERTEYELAVSGPVQKTANTEANDSIERLDDDISVLRGVVVGGTDTFRISSESDLKTVNRNGKMSIHIDGNEQDLEPLQAAFIWNNV